MINQKTTLPNTDIVLDETIYPRARIDQKRVALFAENIREAKDDHERCKSLNWGLRTWDLWGWPDCDKRFGDDWPGRIPAQLIGHLLYYFTQQNDLIFDPMAGGGVTPDTCLAFNRRCWAMDMIDSPDKRSEIEPHFWDIKNNQPCLY